MSETIYLGPSGCVSGVLLLFTRASQIKDKQNANNMCRWSTTELHEGYAHPGVCRRLA
jgi:hypothetical protein